MDTQDRMNLILRNTEEVVTEEELGKILGKKELRLLRI
jgi:tyrosyl-tRNA synthetase